MRSPWNAMEGAGGWMRALLKAALGRTALTPPGDTANSRGPEQDWQGEEDTPNPQGCLRLPGLSCWVTMVRQGDAVLRSTLELTMLLHRAMEKWDVQGTLHSTHWCPSRHRGNSCSQGRSDWGDFATWKVLSWFQAEGKQGWGISWVV